GEVVVVDENFGVRITSIVSNAERIKSLRYTINYISIYLKFLNYLRDFILSALLTILVILTPKFSSTTTTSP
ncbi:hypothetical protein FDF65_13505, partial [Clostridium botulinum]|nr:hypothetical protein [Clostridium botulinum]